MSLKLYKNQVINNLLVSKFFHYKDFSDISDLQQIKIIFFLKNIHNKKKLIKYKNKKQYKDINFQQELFLCSNLFYLLKQKPTIKKKNFYY
jgi:hypothetical protein